MSHGSFPGLKPRFRQTTRSTRGKRGVNRRRVYSVDCLSARFSIGLYIYIYIFSGVSFDGLLAGSGGDGSGLDSSLSVLLLLRSCYASTANGSTRAVEFYASRFRRTSNAASLCLLHQTRRTVRYISCFLCGVEATVACPFFGGRGVQWHWLRVTDVCITCRPNSRSQFSQSRYPAAVPPPRRRRG